jgi:hypothetical protein
MSDVIRCDCWLCSATKQAGVATLQGAWQRQQEERDQVLEELRDRARRRIYDLVDEAWEKNGERR